MCEEYIKKEQEGYEAALKVGINAVIATMILVNASDDAIVDNLVKQFQNTPVSMTKEEALATLEKYKEEHQS